MTEPSGIVGVYKPRDWTSFDVVAKLRGILGTRRIGHGGTLDPMAEGVLPIMVGKATRACDILPDTRKEYQAGFRFGMTSDTQDISGEIIKTSPVPVTRAMLESRIGDFLGDQMQVPPMYSAVKVNGKRLYELAREGRSVERKPRPITVMSITIDEYNETERQGLMTVSCGKGTYIRTLINDIGDALGAGGLMTSLIRTYSGGIGLEECLTLAGLEKQVRAEGAASVLRPVDCLFRVLPEIRLGAEEERLYRNGVRLRAEQTGMEPAEGTFRVYGPEGFIGLGRFDKELFRSVKFF